MMKHLVSVRQLAGLCIILTSLPASAVPVGDPFGQHHSTATQITPQNVKKLRNAWILRTGDPMVEAPELMKNTSGQATAILLPAEAGSTWSPAHRFRGCLRSIPALAGRAGSLIPRWSGAAREASAAGVSATGTYRGPTRRGRAHIACSLPRTTAG
ncbi:MAG: hypothetical protein IPH08_09235 [Rhodocyclaceae bacterium]|nr:hypothetical protein [Rhodocyclaceae bacterium]